MTRAKDIANIISDANFGGTLDVAGAFTSLGIDDNANATAITIDSSENVLVGKAGSNFGSAGIELRGSVADFIRDGNTPINVNRLTSDGNMIIFHKDSSVVGKIGNAGARLFINSGTVGLNFAGDGSDQILPSNIGTNRDAAITLGATNVRFKDIYLSGGAFLGGTGTANKLDDYEEGTWTPSHGGNTSYSARTGRYIKVGNKVFITGQVHINALGTGSNAAITGLPFTSVTTVNGNPAGTLNVNYYANLAIAVIHIAGYVTSNATTINTVANVTANATIQYNTGAFYQNNSRIDFSMTYETA